MKEFHFTIQAEELNGLRQFSTNPRNGGGLVSCYNVLPAEKGLEPYEPATDPFEAYQFFDWPFPQFFVGTRRSCLMTRTKVYEISATWNLTEVVNFGVHPEWTTSTWHAADFYGTIIGTNGYAVFWYNPTSGTWQQRIISSTFPLFSTLCNFNGQLIIGNISGSWQGCDEKSVAWSEIGSLVLVPSHTNVAGNRPMPFRGEVFKLIPLGKGVMVYGYGGIGFLYTAEQTFGFKQLSTYGIISRDAAGGDDNEQAFIDESGTLWRITADLQLTKAGYKEFFSGMVNTNPIITFDEQSRYFHIGDDSDGFVLTPQGLGQSFQRLSSCTFTQGGKIGSVKFDGHEDDETAYVITDTYDMRNRGQKTIQTIEVGCDFPQGISVSVMYRNSYKETFRTTHSVKVNKEGFAQLPCSGVDFRFKILFDNYQEVNLDYITIHYKQTDKRSIRGTYNATQDAT